LVFWLLIPAFYLQKRFDMKIDKILIIADDSAPSIKAVKYGFGMARDLLAEVTLLSIVDPINSLGNPDAGVFPDDAIMAAKADAEAFLNKVKKTYGAGVKTELLTVVGEIQPAVIKTAIKHKADLIITGTHGRTGLSLLFHGSVSDAVIHHSPVPVCVVPMDI